MNARNLLAASVAILMVSGVACSKKKKQNEDAPVMPAAEAKPADCSNAVGTWTLPAGNEENMGQVTKLTVFPTADGVLNFFFSGEDFLGENIPVNGEEVVTSSNVQDPSAKPEMSYSAICENDGILAITVKDLTEGTQKERLPSANTSDLRFTREISQKWILMPSVKDASKAVFTIYENNKETIVDLKGVSENTVKTGIEEVVSIDLTRAADTSLEDARNEQKMMREANASADSSEDQPAPAQSSLPYGAQ